MQKVKEIIEYSKEFLKETIDTYIDDRKTISIFIIIIFCFWIFWYNLSGYYQENNSTEIVKNSDIITL